jgi:large subunit ribosomal protein L17
MRHQKAGKKLNRTGSHRNAMFRNMVTSLFEHGRIRTTDAKAKELKRWADRMVTLAKRGDLHARRQAMAVMRDKAVVHKLFEEASQRFGNRAGGYTSVLRIGRRRGDAASLSLVELAAAKEQKEQKKKKPKAERKAAEKAKKETPPKARKEEQPEKIEAAAPGADQEVTSAQKSDVPEADSSAGTQEAGADSEDNEAPESREDQEKT